MARAQYFVVRHEGEWKINFQGNYYSPYASEAAAIRAAVDTALKAGASGNAAQVLVQGDDGKFRIEWTYGRDAFPAAG